MDRISLLSDDLLLKILYLGTTKDAVTTSLLSKRWCSLWKHVPKLTYWDLNTSEYWKASRFVDKFLLLHKAPVLETMNLSLCRNCCPTDIQTWINLAVSRGLQNLIIHRYRPGSGFIRLPRSLYTCGTLVTLKIASEFIVDYVPLTISFWSLKVLALCFVKFSSNELVDRILSGCPVLEDLKVIRGSNDNVKTFTIAVPSLKILTIIETTCGSYIWRDGIRFVINTPSLKSLTIANQFSWCDSLVSMPYLVNADIKLRHGDSKKFEGMLISAKHISLCLPPPMNSCPIGVFNQLVSLNICTCSLDWCRLILNHTPKLRLLRFELKQARLYPYRDPLQRCCSSSVYVQTRWEQPSSILDCLISTLETKKVVMYLLENSRQLKAMSIRSSNLTSCVEKLKMLQELSSTPRTSSKCRVLFI
ncbi:hypothetical protein CARUB_v10027785mg [Capsella rubella]|uniref:FBD domain-containing protein n=1 Tax=Capsella rubella TaxID=81985 RepID=R0EZ45_9BRAS|nr:hypothetical protein CARUB_v10027785mg [Capsella rubella]